MIAVILLTSFFLDNYNKSLIFGIEDSGGFLWVRYMRPHSAITANGFVLGTTKTKTFTGPCGRWIPQSYELMGYTLRAYDLRLTFLKALLIIC